MTDNNDPPKNPFVRWKQHVDAHIGMTLNGLLGIPAMVTKNLDIRRDADSRHAADQSGAVSGSYNADSEGAPAAPSAASSTPSDKPPSSASSHPSCPRTRVGSTSPSSTTSSSSSADSSSVPDDFDDAQLVEWHKFVYYSPYSPLKLQQQQHLNLLPPPVPRDVPFGADPFSFTYADAFEDLLRASSGRPLLDLAGLSFRKLRYQVRYGSAMEPPYVFFHRMHVERLLDAYFPRSTAVGAGACRPGDDASVAAGDAADGHGSVTRAAAALAERDRDSWRDRLQEEEEENEEKGYDKSVGRKADDSRDETRAPPEDDHDGVGVDRAVTPQPPVPQSSHGGLFDELDRVFRVLGRIVDEGTGAAAAREAKSDKNTDADADTKPSAEDELYAAVRSAYTNAEKSLSTLIKSFSGGFGTSAEEPTADGPPLDGAATRAPKFEEEREQDRQGETIRTTEEHVDEFGNHHVKIEVRRLDAEGNEVARETRYTVRSPSPQEAVLRDVAIVDDDDDDDDQTEKADDEKQRKAADSRQKSGWFWK
ncbi:hypothetical protein SPI_08266 [Niveomyces insectorum RCEF 264]|uniref:Uncharacterized protein n=1 Tax=Niveomyces insectorum RCEF 264 TaxID=1081102 RepID=A0A167NI77_9HYPO|nr:hypothetical protein SPI_08266 [Niveomyces insectorum RCEF 264]